MQKGVAVGSTTGQETSTQITRPSAPVSAPGLEYDRFFSKEGIDPFDEIEWDIRSAVIGNEKGSVVFEQRDVEIPRFWSQQATNIVVSKYFRGTIGTPERERSRQAADRPRCRHHHRMGARPELLRQRRRPAGVLGRPEAPARLSEGGVQQPRLVQRRLREAPAVLGLLHQLGAGHDGVDPRPGEDRGDALQVRLRHRLEPLEHPFVDGAPRGRRHGLGSGVLHEGLRRVCGRHQVGRQDASRRQDGHPQRRAPRRRRIHQLQGRGREEGLGADRCRLRRLVHRSGVFVRLLPELEQQRARDRRVHARGAGRRRVADACGDQRRAVSRPTRRAT